MATGQGPPTQRQYAPYAPQQQQYYGQQQPAPPEQQQQQQYQQHQQYQYQQPQQPQYYYPPQQQQYAPPSPQPSVISPPPQQQQFLAELDSTPAPNPRPTSSSTAPAPTAGQGQDAIPPGLFEMHAEPMTAKPDDAKPQAKPQGTVSAASAAASSSSSPPPPPEGDAPAPQKLPVVQANPWGFFLPDDLPEQADLTPPVRDGPEHDMLSVKPLKIVKTGSPKPEQGAAGDVPETGTQGTRPPSGVMEDGDFPGASQLTPAPLKLSHSRPPATHQPPAPAPTSPATAPAAAPATPQLPYPADGPSIPTPESHPQHGAQAALPVHPGPAGHPPGAASPTTFAPSPVTPLHTGVAAAPQPQHSQAPPQQIYVQAALPPTLPVSSYFPQQPSYARPEAAQPGQDAPSSGRHNSVPSISSITQDVSKITLHQTGQSYASPPPSYSQAISQARPSTTSPAPSLALQFHPPPPPPAPLSPHPTGVPLPMSPPISSPYPYSPSSIGADKPGLPHPSPPIPQQYIYGPQAAPPIPQPSYVNGPQHYQPIPPPLPPRTSSSTSGTPSTSYGYPSPYGPPPTRPNYHAPPPAPSKPDSRLFSSAMARKLLNKTTELVDQTITPYLQDHRYRPPYNQCQSQYQNPYPYQYQHQHPNQGQQAVGPQGQYPQQGYGPSQPTYAAPQATRENPNIPRPS
ncbi:hypothetical protein EsH8_III_001350 [Colletotrichum jinshuiense]